MEYFQIKLQSNQVFKTAHFTCPSYDLPLHFPFHAVYTFEILLSLVIKDENSQKQNLCWVSTDTASRDEAITSCGEVDVDTSAPMACRLASVGVELTVILRIRELHVLNKNVYCKQKKIFLGSSST